MLAARQRRRIGTSIASLLIGATSLLLVPEWGRCTADRAWVAATSGDAMNLAVGFAALAWTIGVWQTTRLHAPDARLLHDAILASASCTKP